MAAAEGLTDWRGEDGITVKHEERVKTRNSKEPQSLKLNHCISCTKGRTWEQVYQRQCFHIHYWASFPSHTGLIYCDVLSFLRENSRKWLNWCVPESTSLVFLATLKQSELTGRPIHQICHFCPKVMTELKDLPIAEAQKDFKCSMCLRTDFETKGSTNTMNPRLSFESFKDPELKLTDSLPQVGTFARVRAQT